MEGIGLAYLYEYRPGDGASRYSFEGLGNTAVGLDGLRELVGLLACKRAVFAAEGSAHA